MWHFMLAAEVVPEGVVLSGFLVTALGFALLGVLALAGWAVTKWAQKTGAEGAGTIKAVLLHQAAVLAENVVHALAEPLKAAWAKAAADGKVTSAELTDIASIALAELKKALTAGGLLQIKKVFGWDDAVLDRQLIGVVEKAVVAAKPTLLPTVAVVP